MLLEEPTEIELEPEAKREPLLLREAVREVLVDLFRRRLECVEQQITGDEDHQAASLRLRQDRLE